MTPLNHHHNDHYLNAYRAEIGLDLRQAHLDTASSKHRIRGMVARAFVRIGVTILPEASSVAFDEGVVILREPGDGTNVSDTDLHRAA